METKVCKNCGKELPVTEFNKIGKRGGGVNILSTCKTCMSDKQRAGKSKRIEEARESAKKMRLADFTPRELMQELKRRGYEFEMTYTEVRRISSKNF